MLDEDAPIETASAEEIADELTAAVEKLQTRSDCDHNSDQHPKTCRLARLMAQHVSNETKLRARLTYLETRLRRHQEDGQSHVADQHEDVKMSRLKLE